MGVAAGDPAVLVNPGEAVALMRQVPYGRLTTTGRTSGLLRVTPLQFEEVAGDDYIASARGTNADWFKNIRANPRVRVQIRDRALSATPFVSCSGWWSWV